MNIKLDINWIINLLNVFQFLLIVIAGSKPIKSVETDFNDNRFLVPGYISPFKGQDILLEASN